MKKIEKGTPGYLDYKKKVEIIRTIVYFLIVAAIFILGYVQTHTRLNLLTVVAILGCLPASKALVGVISRYPYASVDARIPGDLEKRAAHLTCVYDLIITSKEKIMPADCAVIFGTTVFGYTHNKKVDLNHLSKHVRDMMVQNRLSYSSVKFFNDYKAFMARVDGLESIAVVGSGDTEEEDAKIRALLLNLSM